MENNEKNVFEENFEPQENNEYNTTTDDAEVLEMFEEKDSDIPSEPIDNDFEIFDSFPEHTADDDAYYTSDETSYTDSVSKRIKKPITAGKVWLIAIVVALVTCLLTAGSLVGILYYFTPEPQPLQESAIIYRDGNDMRTKIDLITALGIKDADDGVPLSVTDVANRVGPTVVGISAEGTATSETMFGTTQHPFASSGTGFVISTDGYIVTNDHVISGATRIVVTLDNDKTYEASLVGTDPRTDLAVLKIEETGLTPAVLGNSSDVQVGELAVAIGNPLGQTLSGTVTAGIISATNRKVTVDGNEYTLLQTDAAINSGNSGGPLANAYGEIIGINNAKIASSGVEGLGFAIPSDIAKPVIEDLISVGYVQGRPLIGINGRNVTEEISKHYDLPIGIYVVSVIEYSAAEQAGIKIGDVITHCNDTRVQTIDELNEIRDKYKAGDTLTLTIIRNEEEMEITLTLGEDKPSVSLN